MEKDILIIPPPTVSCTPPLLWRTDKCECFDGSAPDFNGYGVPMCPTAPPPVICTATISYALTSPAAPAIAATPGCDATGLELAIAVILARLLGAPPN